MSSLRSALRAWIPPALLDAVRRVRFGAQTPEWIYCPNGWPKADAAGPGWNAESIAETQLALWPEFLRLLEGTGPLGINHTDLHPTADNISAHNTLLTFGYVLALAAGGRKELSMLDWGGGIGHYGAFARALLPGCQVEYHCKDVPVLCAAGRKAFPQGTFHEGEESAAARQYGLVLASGSLHYSVDWRSTVRLLGSLAEDYLLITRLPLVREAPSFVVAQRPHACGYLTAYHGWFLNRGELLTCAEECGLNLVREFLVDESPPVPGAPEAARYGGFLFRRA